MKTGAFKIALAILLSVSIFSSQAQNIAIIKGKARTAAAGISYSTTNGKTTIVYQGKEVWSGKTTGQISSKRKVVNDAEYLAVYDGQKMIWENVAGAAAKLK